MENIKLNEYQAKVKTWLINNGIVDAKDNEVMALTDVLEGHGYYVEIDDIKSDKCKVFDSCDEGYANDEENFLDLIHRGYEYLDSLITDEYDKSDDYLKDIVNSQILVSNLIDRYNDRNNNYYYKVVTSSVTTFNPLNADCINFSNRADAVNYAKEIIEKILFNKEVEGLKTGEDKIKYIATITNDNEFIIADDEGDLFTLNIIKEDKEVKFWQVIDNYDIYNQGEDKDVYNFKSECEARKVYNDILKDYMKLIKKYDLEQYINLDENDEKYEDASVVTINDNELDIACNWDAQMFINLTIKEIIL